MHFQKLSVVLVLSSLWSACHGSIFDGPKLNLSGISYHPTSYNSTGKYYVYSNIRYAAPPVNELRWALPTAPRTTDPVPAANATITCTQNTPTWWNITGFPGGVIQGAEDCLFLDVYVPENQTRFGSTPVMFWIHGGGFITGSKTASGDPAGLLAAADEPMIFIAINYRLGALGFLSGHEIISNGTANAGLYDQRKALEWVQENISKFGGDPHRVTVIGESAGAASIMYQLTSYGGKQCPPFQRAILQSNCFGFGRGHANSETRFKLFAETAGCDTLACLRLASTDVIVQTNTQLIMSGSANFFAEIDAEFVPDFAGASLFSNKFCSDVEIMIGNNDDEGGWLLNSPLNNLTALSSNTYNNNSLENTFEGGLGSPLTPDVQDHLLSLYPSPENSPLYSNMLQRAALFTSESVFLSATQAMTSAWKNHVYIYKFSVGYSIHAQDVPYTFFNGNDTNVHSIETAIMLQKYLTRFAINGNPNGPSPNGTPLPEMLRLDASNASVFVFDNNSISYTTTDYFQNERTAYLGSGNWI